jgi:hypothetical protein
MEKALMWTLVGKNFLNLRLLSWRNMAVAKPYMDKK